MTSETVINGENAILGRLTTHIADQAMKGRTVHVINCNDIVVTGDKETTIEKYRNRRNRGAPYTGPHYPSTPKGIVKRAVKGMVPHEKHRGIQALKRVKCHNTVPHEIDEDNAEIIDDANITRTTAQYTTMSEITQNL